MRRAIVLAAVGLSAVLITTGSVHAGGICRSEDGVAVFQHGGGANQPTCESSDGNSSLAVGNGSVAIASEGPGNLAIARGNSAAAIAEKSDTGNTAVAVGNDTLAVASRGDGNLAVAAGNGTRSDAGSGNNNTAKATGNGTRAVTYEGSNNTTVIASGNGCIAEAQGDDLVVTCSGNP